MTNNQNKQKKINLIDNNLKNKIKYSTNSFEYFILKNSNELDESTELDELKESNYQSNTNDIFTIAYKNILKKINNFNENNNKELNEIRCDLKKLEKIHNKSKLKNNKKNKKLTIDWGFAENRIIPKSIISFFNLESDSKLSRTIIGGKFQDYFNKNNLKGNLNIKNKVDKRIYRMDNKLGNLFGLNIEQIDKINLSNDSKDSKGFNFYNYQTWIKKLYIDEFGEINKKNANMPIN